MTGDKIDQASITQFGNSMLRRKTRFLTTDQIADDALQRLITNMHRLLSEKKLGVGLAAPQVGESIAVAVIAIGPTAARPNVEPFDAVIINPRITETFGRRSQLWEGCLSSGLKEAGLFAKVPRYKKIQLEYYDRDGQLHNEVFTDFPAHVIQHEVDHLNGVLFVDKVVDTKTYMTFAEYRAVQEAQSEPK